jgi:hypothetical protein
MKKPIRTVLVDHKGWSICYKNVDALNIYVKQMVKQKVKHFWAKDEIIAKEVELRFKFERRKDFPNCTVLYYEEVI